MLAVGAEVDRYVVEALLGSGGMAAVYRVRHRALATTHALKVLTNTVPEVRDRLVVEGRIQAELRHPNLVAVTDVLEVAGAPALLMDYVAGVTLDGWIAQRGALPLAEVEAIFGGVLAGVGAAHARGLVHRDLKPANVLLDLSGPRPVPRVSDFGIAKVLADDGAPIGRTRTGVMMGSPPYMSPEQLDDARGVDARADVFALGCILYEMLAGRGAFDHPSLFSTFSAIKEGRWTPVEALRADVPAAWRTALGGCLEPDRERRIADCARVAAVFAGAPWPPGPATPSAPRPQSLLRPTVTAVPPSLPASSAAAPAAPAPFAPAPAGPRRTVLDGPEPGAPTPAPPSAPAPAPPPAPAPAPARQRGWTLEVAGLFLVVLVWIGIATWAFLGPGAADGAPPAATPTDDLTITAKKRTLKEAVAPIVAGPGAARPLSDPGEIAAMARRVMLADNAAFHACHDDRAKIKADVPPDWVVAFTIRTDGVPTDVKVEPVTGDDPPLARCLGARVEAWRFHTVALRQEIRRTWRFGGS